MAHQWVKWHLFKLNNTLEAEKEINKAGVGGVIDTCSKLASQKKTIIKVMVNPLVAEHYFELLFI